MTPVRLEAALADFAAAPHSERLFGSGRLAVRSPHVWPDRFDASAGRPRGPLRHRRGGNHRAAAPIQRRTHRDHLRHREDEQGPSPGLDELGAHPLVVGGPHLRAQTINARAETIAERPLFSESFARRRLICPVGSSNGASSPPAVASRTTSPPPMGHHWRWAPSGTAGMARAVRW